MSGQEDYFEAFEGTSELHDAEGVGYIMSKDGGRVDPGLVNAITNLAVPKNAQRRAITTGTDSGGKGISSVVGNNNRTNSNVG